MKPLIEFIFRYLLMFALLLAIRFITEHLFPRITQWAWSTYFITPAIWVAGSMVVEGWWRQRRAN